MLFYYIDSIHDITKIIKVSSVNRAYVTYLSVAKKLRMQPNVLILEKLLRYYPNQSWSDDKNNETTTIGEDV